MQTINPGFRSSRVDPPTEWRHRARKARDSWGGGSEASVAVAIADAYRDGIKCAAAFIEEKGQRELAMMLRWQLTESSP